MAGGLTGNISVFPLVPETGADDQTDNERTDDDEEKNQVFHNIPCRCDIDWKVANPPAHRRRAAYNQWIISGRSSGAINL